MLLKISTPGEKLEDRQKRLIIQEISFYPSLYNIRHDDYKKPKLKADQISAIAARLNLSGELVKSTWKSIQTKYRAELRRVKETEVSGAGSNEIYEPSWQFWKDLQFMRDKTIISKTSGNLDSLLDEKKSLPVAASSAVGSFNKSSSVGRNNISQNQPMAGFLAPSSRMAPEQSQNPHAGSNGDSIGRSSSSDITEAIASEDETYFQSLRLHTHRVKGQRKLAMRNEINEIVMKFAYEMQPATIPFAFPPYPYFLTYPNSSQCYPMVKPELDSPIKKEKRKAEDNLRW